MPTALLPAFFTFQITTFYVGGDTSTVQRVASRLHEFARTVATIGKDMQNIESGDFSGAEADLFFHYAHQHHPHRLKAISDTHEAVAAAIDTYNQHLAAAIKAMAILLDKARIDHGTVQTTATTVNTTEYALAVSVATANPAAIAIMKAELLAAQEAYATALQVWNSDITQANAIIKTLGNHVTEVVAVVAHQPTTLPIGKCLAYKTSDHITVPISDVEDMGEYIQKCGKRVADIQPILVPLTGVDKTHGPALVHAVENFRKQWTPLTTEVSDGLTRFGKAAMDIAHLTSSFDKDMAHQIHKLEEILSRVDILEAIGVIFVDGIGWITRQMYDDLTIPARQLGFIGPISDKDRDGQLRNLLRARRQEAAKRNHGNILVGVSPDGVPSLAELLGRRRSQQVLFKPGQFRLGMDYISEQGDWVARGLDGSVKVYPMGAPQGKRVIPRADGAVTVFDGDRTTIYYPTIPNTDLNVGVSDQMLSETFDRGSNTSSQEILATDGTVIMQQQRGFLPRIHKNQNMLICFIQIILLPK